MAVFPSGWFKPNSSMFRPVERFLTDMPVHWIISFTVALLYSFNFISISCCNQTLLLKFERILLKWVEDWNLFADLMGMFGIFFMFFDLFHSSSLIVYSKLYTSFTRTILVADECRNAIMGTTFLPKSPHVYSDPYMWNISLSARVGIASFYMKPITNKEAYSREQLAVGDMLQFFRALPLWVFLHWTTKVEGSKTLISNSVTEELH